MHFFFLISYILLIIVITLISKSKVNGLSGFFLGNRNINPWMSAFSYGTAYFSAVLFIGYAGKIGWEFGLSTLWIVAGNTIVGSYLAWHVLGVKTREYTQRVNASTMPEFIEKRYNSKTLKIVTATIIFIFLVPYSASIYKGLSYLFEQIFGIPYLVVLLLMTLLTSFYLLFGGFIAATLLDFIQGIIMIAGVVLMLIFVINHPTIGGLTEGITKLGEIDPLLVKPIGPPGLIGILSLVILTSIGSWGLPQMVHKFYTIKSETSIKCAKWVSTLFALIITTCAYFTGIFGRLFFPDTIPVHNGIPNPDIIVPNVIQLTLPSWVSAIIMILVLSASMSTLASVVLASSSAIALDLIKGVLKPDISSRLLMLILKCLCVVFVLLSFIMAIMPNPVISLAALSWGAISGCLLAPYLFGLYYKKTSKVGVWSGIVTAMLIVLVGAFKLGMESQYITAVSALAIVCPLVIVPLVSSLIKEPVYNNEYLSNEVTDINKERMLADDLV